MFYGSGVFGIAFSFPVCLRYELLRVRNWAYYDGGLLGESVQLALSVCKGGGFGCIFGLDGDGGHVHLSSRLYLLCLLLCDFR